MTKKIEAKPYPLEEMTIREVILARLEELGATRYDLAHYGGVSASPSTVFRFLSGNRNTFSGNVEQMLASCGLALVAVGQPDWIEEE